ncbi:hypothetical protein [Streptomyces griseoloalbus]|uniref:Uncharacterized protein n=1 Tax=Streptomyces griseoloalbus TaxID=67303 RepID=A0A7W8F9F2_9ACTN|nr:hypothetical protein [Streptomyces albaduncus]MBB5127052.1 hypothetical protein [Streptomyces albaduncus]GGV86023.1 hypothetical protein GCM10010294_66170 [Streptomyces griseoloalbus]GGW75866.1 hypothetical protein GCM10010340_63040 [Streptomyces albaduncus]
MREHGTISRTAGTAVLTLVAVVCTAGLADALRRRRGRLRERAQGRSEAARRHTPHGIPTVPRQRRTGPSAEAVDLTDAERDAFAGLVRRLSEGD